VERLEQALGRTAGAQQMFNVPQPLAEVVLIRQHALADLLREGRDRLRMTSGVRRAVHCCGL